MPTNTEFFDAPWIVLCRAEGARNQPLAGLHIEAFDQDPTRSRLIRGCASMAFAFGQA